MHDKITARSRRDIPSVERTVSELGDCGLPRPVLVAVARRELAAIRLENEVPDFASVVARIRAPVNEMRLAKIQPVINGTGILIHTNFGRAPLGGEVLESLREVASNYSNLEYALTSGERGKRASYLEHNLALLCGAEAATVVNNCAAALILIVRHFTGRKREVVISRGEIIQIGGGFRIPEILKASGAKLHEVGTTNKTALEDYAAAVGPETAMILKVHRSNFFMGGFVEAPSTEALAQLARARRVPFVEDLGSGAIVPTEKLAEIEHEPMPNETLKRGADLVCFSGDKLFAGPQAGVIAGKRRHVSALKRNPFFRALRCDKLILTALQTTVDLHLQGQISDLPGLAMLQLKKETLRARAEHLLVLLRDLPLQSAIGTGAAQVGGGTLPRAEISSVTLDLSPEKMSLEDFASRLRTGSPPVIGYIANREFKLDLRTVFPRQDEQLAAVIRTAAQSR